MMVVAIGLQSLIVGLHKPGAPAPKGVANTAAAKDPRLDIILFPVWNTIDGLGVVREPTPEMQQGLGKPS